MKVRLVADVEDPEAEGGSIPAGTILDVEELSVCTDQGCSFSVSAEEVEPVEETEVAETLEELGFTTLKLDNGGDAYIIDLPDGRYVLVTDGDGRRLPDEDSRSVQVGVYEEPGNGHVTEHISFGAAVAEIKTVLAQQPA